MNEDHVVEEVRQHVLNISSPGNYVKFRVFIDDEETPEPFTSKLDLPSTFRRKPWYPYLSKLRGTPMTTLGQLQSRAQVQENSDSGEIMKIAASSHFYDLDEAAIKLVYGAYLEDKIASIHLQCVAEVEHRMALFLVPGSAVLLAAVQFGKLNDTFTPASTADKSALIPDGTNCVVSFRRPGSERLRYYDAVSVPNIISLPTWCDLVVLFSPSSNSLEPIANTLSGKFDENKLITCQLKLDLRPNNLNSQVNINNTLCQPSFKQWHPILLSQEYMVFGHVDVFQDLPEFEVQEAYKRIYALKEWNDRQVEIFKLLRRIPGTGFGFFGGIFGCGKSLVQASIAKLLTDLGKHVLIVAPTNAAVQAISKTVFNNKPELDAVRIVFAGADKAKNISQNSCHHTTMTSLCFSFSSGDNRLHARA